MEPDFEAVTKNCANCAIIRVLPRRTKNAVQLFSSDVQLELVVVDISGELIKSNRGDRFLVVLTERLSKLTMKIPLTSITDHCIGVAFVNRWVLTRGPPDGCSRIKVSSSSKGSFNTFAIYWKRRTYLQPLTTRSDTAGSKGSTGTSWQALDTIF